LAQLKALGLQKLSEGVLPAVLAELAKVGGVLDNVDTRQELQNLIDKVVGNLLPETNPIVLAAKNNSATPTTPSLQNYSDVLGASSGVTSDNLGTINSALNADPIDEQATNSAVKLQSLVDAYVRVINSADGKEGSPAEKLKDNDFSALYLTAINNPNEVSLLADAIDRSKSADVAEWTFLNEIAAAADAVIQGATDPKRKATLADLERLQIQGVTRPTLAIVQAAIAATNDATKVDTVPELQRLAGRAPALGAARLPSLRVRDAGARGLPRMRRERLPRRLRPGGRADRRRGARPLPPGAHRGRHLGHLEHA
jgi:hypothetical protein